MIRATFGTWINYASTVVFQIVLASRFGARADASAFVIVFGISVALTGIVNQAIRAVVLPRLFTQDGRVVRRALHSMLAITAGGIALAGGVFAASGVLGSMLHHLLRSESAASNLVKGGAAFAAAQILVVPVVTIVLAQGRRFMPALAPVAPSVGGIVMLLAEHPPSGAGVLAGLAAGSVVELVALLAMVRHAPAVEADAQSVASWTLATVLLSGCLSAIQPLERVFASASSSAGAAQLFYATRSLAVVQQLVLGGVLLAAISDWTSMIARGERDRLARSVARTTTATLVAVVLAAAVAIVAARPLVGALYERGQFTAAAAASVTVLLLLALPGFCAESVGLVLTQVLLAGRRNRQTAGIGAVNVVVRVALIVALAQVWGVRGVVVAYSASTVLLLVPQVIFARRLVAFDPRDAESRRIVRDGALVATGTLAAAAVAGSAFGSSRPSVGVAVVAVVFAAVAVLVRLDRQLVVRHA